MSTIHREGRRQKLRQNSAMRPPETEQDPFYNGQFSCGVQKTSIWSSKTLKLCNKHILNKYIMT